MNSFRFLLVILCVTASCAFQPARQIVRSVVLPCAKISSTSSLLSNRRSNLLMSSAPADLSVADIKPKTNAAWQFYLKATDFFSTLFPVWTLAFASLALLKPEAFAWFTTKYFTATLGALMLSMGITLTPADFTRVLQQPGAVFWGFILCYGMCPLLGLGLGKAFNLPIDLIAGIVLVGSINGGQASNLCTYIAKGDVALSVLMTTVTTVAGIFATPLLCKLLLGAVVPVDAVGIAKSCIEVVLAPIVVGMAANKFFPKTVEKVVPLTPVIGVISTCLLVASAVAQCAPAILSAGLNLQFPIMLLHLIGGIAGYWVPRMFKFSEVQCRTMAIETAMKSSAFGFLLAKLHFKQYATRVPSAVSVVWMALVGAILAVVWRFIPIKEEEVATAKK